MNRKLAAAIACALVLAITAGEASAHRWRGRWSGGPRYYNSFGYGSNRGWSNYQSTYPRYRYPTYNYGYSYPGYNSYSTPSYYYPGSYYYYGRPSVSFYYGY